MKNKGREEFKRQERNRVRVIRKAARERQINSIATLARNGVLNADDVFFLMPRVPLR